MADHRFILIVPPEGLLEVIHADRPIDPEATLRSRHGQGVYIRTTSAGITTSWLSSEYGQLNPRAREVFARVTRVHLVFSGTVLFEGIAEDLMGEIVGQLSLRTAGGGAP